MTCEHCCGADQLFDVKSAKKELNKYRKNGSRKSTRKLLSSLKSTDLKDKTLLDIGGGIGAIQWYFFETGGLKTTDVDSSSGYISIAEDYAKERGFLNSDFIVADFNDVVKSIERHDVVTLDKVVCCYPDYRLLLENAISRANHTLALTMPFGGFISKALAALAAFYFLFKRNPFRTFVHDPKSVQNFIESKGFVLKNKATSFPWLIRIYEKDSF